MNENEVPQGIFHYYNRADGPFRSISRLSFTEANNLQNKIRRDITRFAGKRDDDYLYKRNLIEKSIRKLFQEKGGKPKIEKPHYFVLGECKWLMEWYPEGEKIEILLSDISEHEISFTYGDTFPTFYCEDGKPYRKQIYLIGELPELINNYGLPQKYNSDGKIGPDRYIEAQLWSDYPIKQYL